MVVLRLGWIPHPGRCRRRPERERRAAKRSRGRRSGPRRRDDRLRKIWEKMEWIAKIFKKLKNNTDLKEFESIWILDFGLNMDQAMVYHVIWIAEITCSTSTTYRVIWLCPTLTRKKPGDGSNSRNLWVRYLKRLGTRGNNTGIYWVWITKTHDVFPPICGWTTSYSSYSNSCFACEKKQRIPMVSQWQVLPASSRSWSSFVQRRPKKLNRRSA